MIVDEKWCSLCCSVLQCVAVCGSDLRMCSVLQCVAVCCIDDALGYR